MWLHLVAKGDRMHIVTVFPVGKGNGICCMSAVSVTPEDAELSVLCSKSQLHFVIPC